MKDWDTFKPSALPVGSGKRENRLLGDRALFTLGGSDGFRTRIVPLPSGGQLRVRTKNGMPEYVYEPGRQGEAATPDVELKVIANLTAALADLYMSSGAYTFGPLGGINQSDPMLTIEPVLYKSSSVGGVEASDLVQYYDKTPPANAEASKIFNHVVSPGGLNTPKTNMLNAIPSKFSGLMRRYVQARYGSGRTSHDVSSNGSGIFIGSEYSRTTGLLKFGNDYVFVELSTDSATLSIKYWKVLIEEVDLVSGSEAQQILALSNAEVDALSEKSISPISIAPGTPISYGWIFSLTTNKATVCVNEFINGYMYDRRMWRLMSLSFTYADETLSCAYSLVEEVDGASAPTLGLIWSPAGESTIWYNQTSTPATPASNQDFPVHSFYVGDVLKKIRWKWVYQPYVQYDGQALNRAVSNQCVKDGVVGQGVFSSEYEYNYGQVRTHGFYFDGGSPLTSSSQYIRITDRYEATFDDPAYETPVVAKIRFESSAVYARNVGVTGTNLNKRLSYSPSSYEFGESPPLIGNGNHWSTANFGSAIVSGGVKTHDTGSGSHVCALVIPKNDCSSVYIGYKKDVSYTRSRIDYTGGFYNAYCAEWYASSITGPIIGKWVPTVVRQHYGEGLTSNWYQYTTTKTNTPLAQEQKILVELHGVNVTPVGTVDSEIFYTGSSALSKQVQVISSGLFNDLRYDSNALTDGVVTTTSSYPTDITLFVGAA